MSPLSRCCRLLGVFLLLLGARASAVDFTVTRTDDPVPNGCQPGDCSLREAVITANALSGADRILLPAGLYQLTIAGNAFNDATVGDLDIFGDVEIIGAGAASTTILALNTNRQFNMTPGASLIIRDLRLDGGRAGVGGAILQNGVLLTVQDAILSGNQATSDGGAIRASGGAIVLQRVQLLNNTSGGNGGAIESGSADLHVSDSTITGNSAVNGGAIYGYNINVTRSLIQNNTASGDGGALHGIGGCSCTALEVHESTLAGNGAVNGGAIYTGPVATINLSTLSGNSASSRGGAIYATTTNGGSSNDQVHLSSSTLYLNTATTQASAIYFFNDPVGLGKAPLLGNSLIRGTCVRAGNASTFDAALGNIESPGNTCNLSAGFSAFNVPAASLLLGALTNNGGPTPTHLPQAGSAAISAGWNITCAKFDQRGFVRADGSCDTGAVEASALNDVIFRDGFEL